MKNKCDHSSVALILRGNGKILLIERKKYNPGFALPAGHQDGLCAEEAALKELFEEVGLSSDEDKIRLCLAITLDNPCARAGGTQHFWTVYEVLDWRGDLKPSDEEIKKAVWAGDADIQRLAKRLEGFMGENNLKIDNLPEVVRVVNGSPEWSEDPGLEPPMYVLFKALKII